MQQTKDTGGTAEEAVPPKQDYGIFSAAAFGPFSPPKVACQAADLNRLTQWSPCGLQGRSGGITAQSQLYYVICAFNCLAAGKTPQPQRNWTRTLRDPPADPVEPVWPAGSVGWATMRSR